jgi:hypothetical protein
MEELRAQTAHLPKSAHTASTVTVNLPADFSFLKSPREGDEGEVGADGDEERVLDSGRGLSTIRRDEFGGEYRRNL